MSSKLCSMNKAILFQALLGWFVFVIVCSSHYGLLKMLKEDSGGQIKENLDHVYGIVTTRVRDGFITLTIKFLHFFVAKSLQFRLLPLLQSASFVSSLLFWVAFIRAISSMANDCVCYITSKAQ